MSIATRVTNALNVCWAFNLFTESLGDLLCMKVYQHGTSPGHYHKILQEGTKVTYFQESGESAVQDCSEVPIEQPPRGTYLWHPNAIPPLRAINARIIAIQSAGGVYNTSDSKLTKIMKGIIPGFTSPILKFYFFEEETTGFVQDPEYHAFPNNAVISTNDISPDHIGCSGLQRGCNGKVWDRIKQNKGQFCTGIFKCILSLAMMALFIITVLHAKQTLNWVELTPSELKTLKIFLICYGSFKGAQILARFFYPYVAPCANSH